MNYPSLSTTQTWWKGHDEFVLLYEFHQLILEPILQSFISHYPLKQNDIPICQIPDTIDKSSISTDTFTVTS